MFLRRCAPFRQILPRMSGPAPTPSQCGLYLRLQTAPASTDTQNFDIANNPMYTKYADKLKHLKESNPALYEEKLNQLLKPKSGQSQAPTEVTPAVSLEYVAPPSDTGKQTDTTWTNVKQGSDSSGKQAHADQNKTLDNILKLDLLKDKTAEEIGLIWKQFHVDKPFVFAVIPAEEYAQIRTRAKEYPTFVYPLPKGDGYEMFLKQFSAHSFYFTQLLAYQTHKENAPICLTLDHYTELAEEKGIVLMRGEANKDVLSPEEAQVLSLQVPIFYGRKSTQRFDLVRKFNCQPDQFDFRDLIIEFQACNTGAVGGQVASETSRS